MQVKQLVPHTASIELEAALNKASGLNCLTPFAPVTIDFLKRLSERFFSSPECKELPELQAVAFSFRPAEIEKLSQSFEGESHNQTEVKARGLIFHIPPANVDTVFLYSWVYALLLGNKNIIR